MLGLTYTSPMFWITLFLFVFTCEACIRYVPPPALQCVPCSRVNEGRSRGSIWNEMYNEVYKGISEEKSPRFGFPIVPTGTPCCDTSSSTTTTTTQAPSTRLENATGRFYF